MKRVVAYLALFLALSYFVSASPTIDFITVTPSFERSLEIKFNASSSVNLTSFTLIRANDNTQIASLPLSGDHVSDFYRDSDVNVVDTYTYVLTVWDASGENTILNASGKVDVDAPQITSPSKILSNMNKIDITTDEPAKCSYGYNPDALTPFSTNGSTEHIATDVTGLNQGANTIYVLCADIYGNEMQKATTIEFDYDLKKPSKPVLTVAVDNGTAKLSWLPSTDENGIKEYRVYKSTDETNVFTSSSPQSTTELSFSEAISQTTYYAVGAVDAAGNEERSDSTGVAVSGQPAAQAQTTSAPAVTPQQTATEPTASSGKKSGFRLAYLAWIVFVIIIIWIIIRYNKQKTDKFGLDSYIHDRRRRFG